MMVVLPSASWDTDVFPMDSIVWRVMGSTDTFGYKNVRSYNDKVQNLHASYTMCLGCVYGLNGNPPLCPESPGFHVAIEALQSAAR